MRELILSEIRRLATANGGQPPGKKSFERLTGISEGQWTGVFWARWSDALREAGFQPNQLQRKLASGHVLSKLAEACRHYGRLPTRPELKLYRRHDPSFPSSNVFTTNHFQSRAEMATALLQWCRAYPGNDDVAAMLSSVSHTAPAPTHHNRVAQGFVYLIQSGGHYKIGRSDEIERRIKEIRVALPEAATLVHTIRTDDPAGIEAYWHRRFSDRRANGEWFRLSSADVVAFKKRKFQ